AGLAGLAVMVAQPHGLAQSTSPLDLLTEVFGHIERSYVEDVPPPRLIHGAVVGLLDGLDGSSELADVTAGAASDADVGLLVTRRKEKLVVITPVDGTSGQRMELAPGDQILKIDGAETRTMERAAAARLLRGRAGTTVSLSVARPAWSEPR